MTITSQSTNGMAIFRDLNFAQEGINTMMLEGNLVILFRQDITIKNYYTKIVLLPEPVNYI